MSALNMRWRGSRKLVRSAAVQEQIFNLRISKETSLELARDLCREAKQELYKKCRSACKKQVLFCSFLQLFHLAQSICISHAPAFCIHSAETGSILATSHGGWASKMQKYCPLGKNNFSEITVRWNKKVTLFWTRRGLKLFVSVWVWKTWYFMSTNSHFLPAQHSQAHQHGWPPQGLIITDVPTSSKHNSNWKLELPKPYFFHAIFSQLS